MKSLHTLILLCIHLEFDYPVEVSLEDSADAVKALYNSGYITIDNSKPSAFSITEKGQCYVALIVTI